MTINTVTEDELRSRQLAILDALGISLDQLREREENGLLSAEEWEAWEQLSAIDSLLDG
jgi:hypothetical protein